MNDKPYWKQILSKDLKPGDVISFFYRNKDFIGMILRRDPVLYYRAIILMPDGLVATLTLISQELKLSYEL